MSRFQLLTNFEIVSNYDVFLHCSHIFFSSYSQIDYDKILQQKVLVLMQHVNHRIYLYEINPPRFRMTASCNKCMHFFGILIKFHASCYYKLKKLGTITTYSSQISLKSITNQTKINEYFLFLIDKGHQFEEKKLFLGYRSAPTPISL